MRILIALLVGLAATSYADAFVYAGPGGFAPTTRTTDFDVFVADTRMILDLNVRVDITHPDLGDLDMYIIHVDTGTSVQLFDKAGKSGANVNALFDDEAGGPVPNVGPVNGTFTPVAPLSAFDGESLLGTWRLRIVDEIDVYFDGTVNSWSIEGNAAPKPGTFALPGAALLGCALRRRRRKA